MPKIIILKGLPASGKSTFAKDLVNKHQCQYKRVNKDDLRAMLDNSKWSRNNEKFVLEVRDSIIHSALVNGFNIIVDDTNLDPKHESRLKEIAKDHGADVEVKPFDVPVDECLKRDKQRASPVGEKVILEMYNRYLKKATEPVKYNPDLLDVVICDIDGTLALMNGRGPFEWHEVGTDKVNEPIANLVRKLWQFYPVIIFSGRDEVCRKETEEWLSRNGIPFKALYMRPQGSMVKDFIVKEEMYRKNIENIYNVKFVLDDRQQVVDLWRSLGLTCLQVADGKF
jgi:predicted kinase